MMQSVFSNIGIAFFTINKKISVFFVFTWLLTCVFNRSGRETQAATLIWSYCFVLFSPKNTQHLLIKMPILPPLYYFYDVTIKLSLQSAFQLLRNRKRPFPKTKN